MTISRKDELYTFDELTFIDASVHSDKTCALAAAVKENKNSQAILFMPEASFSIFSMFTGDNSICSITKEDVSMWIEKCSGLQITKINRTEADHICKKLKVLKDFLDSGNGVKPVVSDADNFCTL